MNKDAKSTNFTRWVSVLAPKILPWLARKAGVPLERAQAVWRGVVQDANEIYPNKRERSACHAYVARELRRRIAAEGRHRSPQPEGDFGVFPAQALIVFECQCRVFRHLCLSWAHALKAAARAWSLPGCKRPA